MNPISVVIITKNAGSVVGACIDSVRGLADEVVILDSGSVDGTREACVCRGARFIETDWPGFGPQKNRAVQAARNDWVLCLDADERLAPSLLDSIRAALEQPAFSAYRFARSNRFLGRYLKYGEGYPDWSLRLFDRRFAYWSDDVVHEKVVCAVPVGTLSGDLLHDSAETLESYLAKQNLYTSLAATVGLAEGRRVSVGRLLLSPIVRFVKFYFFRAGYRDGLPGLVHILVGCFNSFVKYAKMLEQQRGRGQ